MIQRLLQEKRSYEIMLSQFIVSFSPPPKRNPVFFNLKFIKTVSKGSDPASAKQESEVEALREQKRLLLKLVEQKKKVRSRRKRLRVQSNGYVVLASGFGTEAGVARRNAKRRSIRSKISGTKSKRRFVQNIKKRLWKSRFAEVGTERPSERR